MDAVSGAFILTSKVWRGLSITIGKIKEIYDRMAIGFHKTQQNAVIQIIIAKNIYGLGQVNA
jgi:hypothetical protein